MRSSTAADVASRADRAQLDIRVQELERAVQAGRAARTAEVSEISARLLEMETQFKGMSNAFNVGLQQQDRQDAMLWSRAFPNVPFTPRTFFAQLYQPSATPIQQPETTR